MLYEPRGGDNVYAAIKPVPQIGISSLVYPRTRRGRTYGRPSVHANFYKLMDNEPNIFEAFSDAVPQGLNRPKRENEPLQFRLENNQDEKVTVEVDSNSTPRPLFNGRKPQYVLKSERPEHRAVIMLAASGMNYKEIAETLGKSAVHVQTIVKQDWAQRQILQEIENAGREPVRQLLQNAAFEAAERLVAIAENAESEETKRKANNDILDRVFGKATNIVQVQTKQASDLSDDELAAIVSTAKRN